MLGLLFLLLLTFGFGPRRLSVTLYVMRGYSSWFEIMHNLESVISYKLHSTLLSVSLYLLDRWGWSGCVMMYGTLIFTTHGLFLFCPDMTLRGWLGVKHQLSIYPSFVFCLVGFLMVMVVFLLNEKQEQIFLIIRHLLEEIWVDKS